ncbi:DUF302 domain-containing protein [Hoeflea sp. TYP-13]|uniref:DUF302 domain-containing protein n=1 Tax=Hoeflea sp. TYP-13 TaxID=3230023 RepID=UPI0034C64E7B
MIRNFLQTTWSAVTIATAIVGMPAVAAASDVTEYIAEAPFEDVRQDLGDAVINRGYKIDYEAYIGEMLERTSADVGGKKEIYKNAEFIQFCSAVLSRAAMEADPANIAYCPYVLFAYELADEPGKVHVGFRRLDERGSEASKAALAKVNALLDEIAREATE